MMLVHSFAVSCLFLAAMYGSCSADGVIDIPPETQHANLSGSATFYCRATGINAYWIINGNLHRTENRTDNSYVFTEITEDLNDGNIVHDIFVTIQATVENNQTAVMCASQLNFFTFSPPVQLIVFGGPGAPDVRLRMVNSELIVLEWDTPFTWNHTTIEHYRITSSNPDWTHTMYTDTSLQLQRPASATECAEYTFTVLANNGVAEGEATTISGGFPIAPVPPDDAITTEVSFTVDLQPIIHVTVKLPRVCSYQTVRYLITIRDTGSNEIFQYGPYQRLYGEGEAAEITTEELSEGNNYLAGVTIDILDVEEINPEFSVSTRFSSSLNEATTELLLEGTQQTAQKEVTPLIVGLVCATVLVIIIVVVVTTAVILYRKRKSAIYQSAGRHPKAMVTNPIYDNGQTVYDTIADPPPVRPIQLTSSTSAIPPPTPTSARPLLASTSPASTPNSAYPLLGHLQTQASIDPAYSYPPPQPLSFPALPAQEVIDDGYTTMTSAGGLHSKINPDSGQDESRLDRDSPEVVRYVLNEPGKKTEDV